MTHLIKMSTTYTINPRRTWWVPYWDTLMFAACIYTAVFLPIEIGVIRETKVNVIFVISLVLSFLFAVDMGMNVRRAAYPRPCTHLRTRAGR